MPNESQGRNARWGFRSVVVIALLGGLPIAAEPYAAHPELRFEVVIAQQAALLVRASQMEIARIHSATADRARRSEILAIVHE